MPDGRRSELGVLFVHGVGEQKRGETLIRCADPLQAWLHGWVGADPKRGPVAETDLAPADGAPAHTRLDLRLRDGGRLDWLLAESWWGEAVRAPTPGAVLKWVGLTGRRLVWQQRGRAGRVFRRDIGAVGANWRLLTPWEVPAGAGRVLDRAARLITRIVEWIATAVILIVALGWLSVALVLALALVALALVPPARPLIRRVQLSVGNGIGDPQVLESSPVAYEAMVTHVRRDLDWLAARCRQVAVVAHSQGSVIAYDALRRRGAASGVGLLVTYGSALDLARDDIDLPDLEWRDFYAGSDAVADGPLWSPRTTRHQSEPVDNLGSVIGDHVRYWDNPEQFVSGVASALGELTGRPLGGDEATLADARRDRRARVTWLVVARTAFLTAVPPAIVLLGNDDLPPLGAWAVTAGDAVLRFLVRRDVGPSVQGGVLAAIAGAVFAAVVASVVYRLLAVNAWLWWSGASARWLRSGRTDRAPALPRRVFALCGLGLPALAVVLIFILWGQERLEPFGVDVWWIWVALGGIYAVAAGALAAGKRLAEPIPRALLDAAQVWEGGEYALARWRSKGCFEWCKVTVAGFGDRDAVYVKPVGAAADDGPPDCSRVPVGSLYRLADWERYRGDVGPDERVLTHFESTGTRQAAEALISG